MCESNCMFRTKNIDLRMSRSGGEKSYSNITEVGTEAPIPRLSNWRALWCERRIKVFDGEGIGGIDASAAAVG
jgi:hypothetical protein